jgi:hypothetical protein
MALKQIDPLLTMLGMAVSGDLGDLTMYTRRDGRLVWFPSTRPAKPPSPPQARARAALRYAATSWQRMTPWQKQRWNKATDAMSLTLTGYNSWVHYYLKADEHYRRRLERASGINLKSTWQDGVPDFPLRGTMYPGRPWRYYPAPLLEETRHFITVPFSRTVHFYFLPSSFANPVGTLLRLDWIFTGSGSIQADDMYERLWSVWSYTAPAHLTSDSLWIRANWPDGTNDAYRIWIDSWIA